MNDKKNESIHKYFKVHDENVNNNFNEAKVWILGEQHKKDNHASKITWLIDNFCNEDDIILIESSHDDYHLIERDLSFGTKYLNVDGWDDVFPEIYHDYKKLYIEIILHINHVRIHGLDDDNWINDIYKLMRFFLKFDKSGLGNLPHDDKSINQSLSYELNHLFKKSKSDRIVFFNSVITTLYEYMVLKLHQEILDNLIKRNQCMISIIKKYLDMHIYRKIIVITGVAHITDECVDRTNVQIENAKLIVKSANLIIENYIKNIPHIILIPNEENISYAMEQIKNGMRNLNNRVYTDIKINQECKIIINCNQCYYFMGCNLFIILILIYSNYWNPCCVIISIFFILLIYYYFFCEIHIEINSKESEELLDRLNSLTCFQLLDVIKELSNNINILPQKNLII